MQVIYKRTKVQRPFRMTFGVTDAERKNIMAETSPMGLLLFEYFLRMASVNKDCDLDDDALSAEYFGVSKATTYKWRRTLYNKGFMSSERARSNRGNQWAVYHLGKRAVNAAKPADKLKPSKEADWAEDVL